mmetsp:Transcript_8642/g.18459  ORF Transcript_8642/g.18459 Transcript_8642/m.18459 type:complete len:172 (+) Transcript_8642:43-558(+)
MTFEQSLNPNFFLSTPTIDRHKYDDHADRNVGECPPPPPQNNYDPDIVFFRRQLANSERLNPLEVPSFDTDEDNEEFSGFFLISPDAMNGNFSFRSIEENADFTRDSDVYHSQRQAPPPRRRINLRPRMSSRHRSVTPDSYYALPSLSNSSVLLRPRPIRPDRMKEEGEIE